MVTPPVLPRRSGHRLAGAIASLALAATWIACQDSPTRDQLGRLASTAVAVDSPTPTPTPQQEATPTPTPQQEATPTPTPRQEETPTPTPSYGTPPYQYGRPTPPPTCYDGKKNNGETDIDCGGRACVACAFNKLCIGGSDCQSGTCTRLGRCGKAKKTPTPPPSGNCFNQMQDGDESDVDCGGSNPQCPRCGIENRCFLNSDCRPGLFCGEGWCFGDE